MRKVFQRNATLNAWKVLEGQYGAGTEAQRTVLVKLKTLPVTATPDDVEAIVGHKLDWLRLHCHTCGLGVGAAVVLSEDPYFTACQKCLRRALLTITGAVR